MCLLVVELASALQWCGAGGGYQHTMGTVVLGLALMAAAVPTPVMAPVAAGGLGAITALRGSPAGSRGRRALLHHRAEGARVRLRSGGERVGQAAQQLGRCAWLPLEALLQQQPQQRRLRRRAPWGYYRVAQKSCLGPGALAATLLDLKSSAVLVHGREGQGCATPAK